MGAIDNLIANAESRANSYSGFAGGAINQVRSFIDEKDISLVPPIDFEAALIAAEVPPYARPIQAGVPTPVYVDPPVPIPTAPSLINIGSIDQPAARTEPVINTSGLFLHPTPSSNLPTIDETPPDLHVDQLVAELNQLVAPRISDLEFPEIHEFTLGAAPVVTLPEYDAPAAPDAVRDPREYGDSFESAYARMVPEMQAFVDDKVSTWVATYAPEYTSWVTALEAKVTAGMNGGALPDQFEAAMITRARGRVQEEFDSANNTAFNQFKRSGFMEPPGVLNSNILQLRIKNAAALANQSTDIYIERRKTEVQHAQFSMNLASSQITAVRNTAISYIQSIGDNMGRAVQYANSLGEQMGKVFEHLVARSKLSIDILNAIGVQYEVKLKAALSAHEGYRLALESEKIRTDVDLAKVRQIEAQLNAEGQNITRYSAIVDTVVKKASVEELKTKEYGIRSEIFGNKIKAQIASYDVYKAAMDGDQSKLDGELSKLKVFESLLNMDNLRLDAQVKHIAAQVAGNDGRIQVFKAYADVYRQGADIAITKFTAQAEVKKLAQALYGQELTNAIEQFKVGLELPKLLIDSIIRQYQARMQGAIAELNGRVEQLSIAERGAAAGASAAASIASAALGSLNTVASSAISATA
jgi:hypothetical protein